MLEEWYRTEDVQRQRDWVASRAAVKEGEKVLDIGVGPGFFASALAQGVGAEGRVIGLDISPSMVQMAQRNCQGLSQVSILEGDACNLSPLEEEGPFDCLISTQVYEYVENVSIALQEAFRLLHPHPRYRLLQCCLAHLRPR